jgi:hypothetical protein
MSSTRLFVSLGLLLISAPTALKAALTEKKNENTNELAKVSGDSLGSASFVVTPEGYSSISYSYDALSFGKHVLAPASMAASSLTTFHSLFFETAQLNSRLTNYFNFVMTHLNGFRIMPYSKEAFKSSSYVASYLPHSRILALPILTLASKGTEEYFHQLECLRHEMHHAAIHAAQLTLNQTDTGSVECYYPRTTAEYKKVTAMLKKGDAKIDRLEKMLEKEESGAITSQERKILEGLRKSTRDEYLEHYKTFGTARGISEKDYIKVLEKMTGKKFVVGQIFHMPPSGPVKIEKIEAGQQPGTKNIKFSFTDPLFATIEKIKRYRDAVSRWPVEEGSRYLYERAAHMQGGIQQSIIDYAFPELQKYTHDLIDAAKALKVFANNHPITHHIEYQELQYVELFRKLAAPVGEFEKATSEFFIPWAKLAIQAGKYREARVGLETLIYHNQYVHEARLELARLDKMEGNNQAAKNALNLLIQNKCPEPTKGAANLELAKIAYEEKDFKAAAAYYGRAEKSKTPFNTDDHIDFSVALKAQGLLKDAEKQVKKANQLSESPRMRP